MSGAPVNISQAFQTLDWLSSERSNKFPLQVQPRTTNSISALADVIYHRRGEEEDLAVGSEFLPRVPTPALRHRSYYTDAQQERPWRLNCNAPAILLQTPPTSPFYPFIDFILGAIFQGSVRLLMSAFPCETIGCRQPFLV